MQRGEPARFEVGQRVAVGFAPLVLDGRQQVFEHYRVAAARFGAGKDFGRVVGRFVDAGSGVACETDGQCIAAPQIVEKALGEAAFKPKALIGFTEIDKTMKPGRKKEGHPQAYADLLKLVATKDGKPKLVPADHPAPAFTRAAEDDFEDQVDGTAEDDFEDN